MASSGSIYQLPDEILRKIFNYLNVHDLVVNIQYVDSHWKGLVQGSTFWRDYVFIVNQQMAVEKIILLLKNMPALQALVAARVMTSDVIHALCENNKFITRLELGCGPTITLPDLEKIVINLPHIQHLAFPLLFQDSQIGKEYSILIQNLSQLKSLRLFGTSYLQENFLEGIASKCPLLHEIDLGRNTFNTKDVTLFLEAKKKVLTKFVSKRIHNSEVICRLNACKQLQDLHFECVQTIPSNIPVFDLPNLKHFGLGLRRFDQEDFSIIVRNLQNSTMCNLLKLQLNCCTLDPLQFENIMTHCVNLKILRLQLCSLPNSDDFKHIGKCTQLEYLNVFGSTITDVAIKVIAEKCIKLRYLDICECPNISDLSVQCLIKCSELKTLKLLPHLVTEDNFKFICDHLTKLRELYIDHDFFSYVFERQVRIPGHQAQIVCKRMEYRPLLPDIVQDIFAI